MVDIKITNLIRDISSNDEMFAGDESHYFGVGQSALECISCSLQAAQSPSSNVRRILDMPCGHGRVLRYLRAAFPEAEITACDLLRDGVDYCATTFGAIPIYSDENPAKIGLEQNAFDLIWVGSLLTHLDSNRWAEFLELFHRSLRPGGVLVFSAHGRHSYDAIVRREINYLLTYGQTTAIQYAYERNGFGYAPYSGSDSYGISLSNPAWVFKQIDRVSEMRVVHFSERAWDKHHDAYVCIRDPDWQVSHPFMSIFTLFKRRLMVKQRLRDMRERMRSKG